MQEVNMDDGQCNDSYPSNEEILNYICGQNSKCCDARQIDDNRKSPNEEERLCTSTEKFGHNIGKAIHSMTNHDDCIKSVLSLDTVSFDDEHIVQQNSCNVRIIDTGEGSSQNIQMAMNNTEEDHSLSAEESSKNEAYATLNTTTKSVLYIKHKTTCHWYPLHKSHTLHLCSNSSVTSTVVEKTKHDSTLQEGESFHHEDTTNGTSSHAHNSENTIDIEITTNFGQLLLDSSDKLTEKTLTSSVSSYSINVLSVKGEYTENKLSTCECNTVDDAVYIPMQLCDLYQNVVKQFDDKAHLPTSTTEGEYIDPNIAVQENS